MANRQVSVAKAVTGAHAGILGATTVTVPLTITPTVTTGSFSTVTAPVYKWLVPAATYTTITALIVALNASTPLTTSPSLASVLTFSATGTKVKVTFIVPGAQNNTQTLTGFPMTQVHLAGVAAAGGVTGVTAVRLWQTVSTLPTVTKTTGIFLAGNANDPMPVTIENINATHSAWLGQGTDASMVTKTTGFLLKPFGSLSFSVVGTDRLYAIATTVTVKISVMVGKQ